MGEKPVVRVSVRGVVETTLHDSDLAPAAGAAKRMREGAIAHRARQSDGARLVDGYRAEVALAADYESDALTLHVTGRADAIFTREDGTTVVEEIKLGAPDAPLVPAHRAQAAMYGHMLCAAEGLGGVVLCVLYVDERGGRLACYEEKRSAAALAAEFDALCAPAAAWEAVKLARRQRRDQALAALPFPYEQYRAGQRKFAANVYVAIREKKRLFAQAPTGIGKTMAAMYPALRALGEGLCGRVLFLTARTTGRRSAMDALARLTAAGARLLAVEITAKDKVCPRERRDCRPEVCPLAEGFYDRLPDALGEAMTQDGALMSREAVERLAKRHRLCPFELSLELAKLADAVVCDFNYMFDPVVAMDALLAGGPALLIDEAHQLAPRVRDAYSAVLRADDLREIRRAYGKEGGRKGQLYRTLSVALKALETASQTEEFASGRLTQPPRELTAAMEQVTSIAAQALAEEGGGQAAADAFSLGMGYGLAAGRLDERYAVLTSGEGKHAAIELALLTSAKEIYAVTKRARGTVFFSATLAPFDAAQKTLGSGEGDACLMLPSPFLPEQLDVAIAPIDIRYAVREQTAPQVAQVIGDFLRAHPGNAMVFFPSYAYMARIGELLLVQEGFMDTDFLTERRGMREEERGEVLAAFERTDGGRAVLLGVLGGSFGEGIDLPGERLCSVAIVSTGLPQPDARLRAMQAYYDEAGEDGFSLCMTLPGMVRVIQAAGRLIRTDTDAGALLLIDRRFTQRHIRRLMQGTLMGAALAAKEP